MPVEQRWVSHERRAPLCVCLSCVHTGLPVTCPMAAWRLERVLCLAAPRCPLLTALARARGAQACAESAPLALSPGIRVVSRQPGGSDAGEAACGSWESRGQSAVGLLHPAPSPAAPAAHKSTGKPAAASGTARAAGCRATARQSPGPGSAACPLGGFGKSPHHSQPHSLVVKGRNRK